MHSHAYRAVPTARPTSVEQDGETTLTTDEALRSVTRLAEKLEEAYAKEAELTATLKAHAETRRAIEERELPEAMDNCGLESFRLRSGREVLVEPVVAGSIPKANLAEALEWLREHGHAGLIKHEVAVYFPKGDDSKAELIKAILRACNCEVEEADTVHPQTLGAWAREMFRDNLKFPLELLGIYSTRRAKIKDPAKPKAKK